MRYVVIGAGAVGGTIGGRLHRQGYQATLVARGDHLAAIRERGLLLATPDWQERLGVPALADPAGNGAAPVLEPDTVLVLTVKSQDTAAALAAWADLPVRGGGVAADRLPLVCAQNGVANEPAALRLFRQVYAACVWLPATFLEPGTVLSEGYPYSGMLQLGRYPAGIDDTARRIAEDLTGAGLLTYPREDPMRWKRGKLLGNLGNGIAALFGDREGSLYQRARSEGQSALDAAGLAYTTRDEEVAQRGDRVLPRPVAGHQRGGSSTWQSLVRGTGSVEVDYLNGEVVLLGRTHGVPTPVNHAVQQAVRAAVRDRVAPGDFPAGEFEALLAAG